MLGMYRNGNYIVRIYEDGTKIRENNLDNLTPSFPESIDITITKKCDGNCKYCYENCTPNGKHGDILNEKFIDTLHPYTELAINGNDLSHPNLVEFLKRLKEKHIIVNMTVNQKHFMKNIPFLHWLCDEKYIYGLGISLVNPTSAFIAQVKEFPNAVIHVINGVFDKYSFDMLSDNDLKLLILGYKNKGRGIDYLRDNREKVEKNMKWLDNENLFDKFKAVCFDNLALEQLHVKDKVSKETWDNYYMGDDGQYTMYIDMVNKKFAISSSDGTAQYDLQDDIITMFNFVRLEKYLEENNYAINLDSYARWKSSKYKK